VSTKPGQLQYRDPKTGAEWTGHGRAPGWIKEVKDRTKFLVAGPGRGCAGKPSPAVSRLAHTLRDVPRQQHHSYQQVQQ
jgi:H-NS histone family